MLIRGGSVGLFYSSEMPFIGGVTAAAYRDVGPGKRLGAAC